MILRSLAPGDDAVIARIFGSTLALGDRVAITPADLAPYVDLCLGWYLGAGRQDAAIIEDEGEAVGYVLVCTAPADHRRWTQRGAARFVGRVGPGLVSRRYPPAAARFYRLRLRDGWSLRRAPSVVKGLGHAHVNLVPGARAGRAGRLAAAHIDDRIAAAGLAGWFGEINARVGERARALERLGGVVVQRTPNHTLSALVGQPVERLTVVRRAA